MGKILKEKYNFDIDDLYNPAYGIVIEEDEKAEKIFEALKKSAFHIEWFRNESHTYNGNDNDEVGFYVSGYYVSFMMVDGHCFYVRIHVDCIDIDIYTERKDLYMITLNSALTDFECNFGKLF